MDLRNFDQVKDAPSRARILKLHPAIQQDVIDTIVAVHARGVELRITYGLRTFSEQDALYAKGRTAPGGKVTNAKGGQSYHNYGLAVDFCLIHADGKVSWSLHEDLDHDGLADWQEVVEEFKRRGFEWGGEWQSIKDNPHVQKCFGMNWREMLRLHDAGKVDAAGYVVLPGIAAQ